MNDTTMNREMTSAGETAAAALSRPPQIAPAEDDYTGEDGLLYCGKCHTPKEAYHRPEHAALLKTDRHPVECACRRAARVEREAAEQRGKHQETVESLKQKCFSDEEMRSWTFDNDNGHTPQMNFAHTYVDEWQTMKAENIGYLLWGRCDSGKSYLAACIANGIMEQEISVLMTNFARILNDLDGSRSRNEYISGLCRYPLLIIDDFGMERGTEYALEQVYNVIDSRYRSRRPLIVTTNLSIEELQNPQDMEHARIYSRVMEMCVPVRCTGRQNRKHTAQRKMELLKNLIK